MAIFKRVLVTGADGFIGSHLVEEMVRRGYQVKAFVHYNSFNSWGWLDDVPREVLNSVQVIAGDIRDPFGVRQAMSDCDGVLHLAALIAIPFSYHSPASYVETNISGTLNILQAARDLKVSKVVHTSTSEVYGTAQYVPIDEVHPLQGQSPYSATKIAADQLALSFYRSFELPVSIIRPFNTFGPRQSARAVIPTMITQILKGQKILNLGSVTPTRDFNFIEDTVNGFISILDEDKSIGEVINIASNYEISVEELAHTISQAMGVEMHFKTESERVRPKLSEVERLWGDHAKALKLLKWSPKYSGKDGLVRGLQKTIDWFSVPKNLERYKTHLYNI